MKFLKISVLICLSLSTLTSCSFLSSLFSNKNNNTEDNNKNESSSDNGAIISKKAINLTINYGDEEVKQTVYTKSYPKINEKLKKGYGCVGFYDSLHKGVKYFDGSGTAVMEWQEEFPTYLYAKWLPLSEFNNIMYAGNTYELSSYCFFGKYLSEKLNTPEYINALKANSDTKIKVSFTFYALETINDNRWTVYFKTDNKYEEENMETSQLVSEYQGKVFYPTNTFSHYSHEGYFTCEDVISNGIYVFITRGLATGSGTIGEYFLAISFII